MTYFFAKTQYPQHTWLNGGQGSDARKYWFVYTQRTPNGPRIDAVTSLQSAGDFGQVYSTSTTYYRVQRADDGTAAAILDWTPRQVWHAATEQLLRGGRRGTFKLTAYSDVTGEDREMPCPFGRVTNGTAHFYGNIAQDGAGSVYYGTTESVSQTWRLNPVTEAWTQLANTPSYSQLGSCMEWFPEANSGSGGLIKSLDFATSTLRVILLNAAGDTWSTLNSAVPNSQHALLCYHPSHARVLVVGGTNTQTAATFLEADGTATASSTACPANVHGMSPAGWVIAHPSGCWLVRSGADLHVYAAWPNATYDDLTWVDLGAAPDAALSNPTMAVDTARGTYGTALITAESGLYAWALPAVTDPNEGLSISATPGTAVASGPAAAVSLALSIAATPASAAASGVSASINSGLTINATPATAAASGASAAITSTLLIEAVPATATASGRPALIVTLLDGSTESVWYFPLRFFASSSSGAVDPTEDLNNLRSLLPSQRQAVTNPDGTMTAPWYRFLDFFVNVFAGGPSAPTMADVQAAIEAALAGLQEQQQTTALLAQQSQTNAEALAATVEVVQTNSLSGASSIPAVSRSYLEP